MAASKDPQVIVATFANCFSSICWGPLWHQPTVSHNWQQQYSVPRWQHYELCYL